MYDEQIEALIAAALTDGVLTEKERQILIRRAVAEGIDADEFEMVLDARLVELQKQAEAATPPPMQGFTTLPTQGKSKSAKYGAVPKCPRCGAIVEAGTAKCSSCGYAFTGIAANSSSERLAQQLQALEKQYGNKEKSAGGKGEGNDDRRISRARATIISSFPVPPTKDDLLEFAVTMRSKWLNTQGVVYRQEKNAYKAKYNECVEKIKIFFPGDKTFASILTSYEADKHIKLTLSEKIEKDPVRYLCILLIGWISLFGLMGLLALLFE